MLKIILIIIAVIILLENTVGRYLAKMDKQAQEYLSGLVKERYGIENAATLAMVLESIQFAFIESPSRALSLLFFYEIFISEKDSVHYCVFFFKGKPDVLQMPEPI